jgi:hypothetical protein
MAIFKVPRITTGQRMGLTLEESEIVYDINHKIFYGGNGASVGGVAIGSGVGNTREIFTLNQTNLDNKYVTLSSSPLFPDTVTLTPSGGIPQINGVDFEVIGDQLSWDGLGLDNNFLELNDLLIIQH